MNIRYKIQSCSSQSQGHPVTNLLAKHSHWQSQRFCDYPLQITISFYQPMLVQSITIASHPTKIPSRINILHHLPSHDDQGFEKYGYITFSAGKQQTNNHIQSKKLNNLQLKTFEVRLVILRNHSNKNNFFNQVALSSLTFTGTPFEHLMPSISNNSSVMLNLNPQMSILAQLKNSFVRNQQFQEAKQVSQLIHFLNRANEKLQEKQTQKQSFVKAEEFMQAKRVKEEIAVLKVQIQQAFNHFYDPQQNTMKEGRNIQILRQKIQEIDLGKSVLSQTNSREKLSRFKDTLEQHEEAASDQQDSQQQKNISLVSHDDKIIPTLISKMKGVGNSRVIPQKSQIGDNQFFQSSENQVPKEPQMLSPSDQANSSHLLEFYEPLFIRKLHSKYWQLRLEAITQVLEELKTQQNSLILTKTRLRTFLFIYCLSLKSTNFSISSSALQMMNVLSAMRPQGDLNHQLHNQLEQSFKLTLKKLYDSNQKIRSQAQKTLLRIIQSSIFGVGLCYSSVVKSYPQKTSALIRKNKLENIQYMVQKYGIGQNGVPQSVSQFAFKASKDQDGQVRKSAINLLKTIKIKGGKEKVEMLLHQDMDLNPAVAKKIVS